MADINKIIDSIIDCYINREYDAETISNVQSWLTEDVHFEEKDKSLWKLWSRLEPASGMRTEEALRQVRKRLGLQEIKPQRQRSRKSLILRVAAVLVPIMVLAGGILYLNREGSEKAPLEVAYKVERSGSGEKCKKLSLHDGTDVLLSANTVIHHSEERIAKLEGEAYFEVARDEEKPFVVQTDEMTVTALGTAFNIDAYPESDVMRVALFEGSVEVDCAGEKCMLKPGEELVFNKADSQVTLRTFHNAKPQWMVDLVNFQQAPMSVIFRSVEQIYETTIVFNEEEILNDIITLKLHGGESLEEAMGILAKVSGKFDYTIGEDNSVTIRSVPKSEQGQ